MSKPQYVKDDTGKFQGSIGSGKAGVPVPRPPHRDANRAVPQGVPRNLLLSHPTLVLANETLPEVRQPVDRATQRKYPTIVDGFTFSKGHLRRERGGEQFTDDVQRVTRTGQEMKSWANLKTLVGLPLLVQPIGAVTIDVQRDTFHGQKHGVRVLCYAPTHATVYDSVWFTPTMVGTFGRSSLEDALVPARLQRVAGGRIVPFRLSPAELVSMSEFVDYYNIYPYSGDYQDSAETCLDEADTGEPFDDGGLGFDTDSYGCEFPFTRNREPDPTQGSLFPHENRGSGNSHTL